MNKTNFDLLFKNTVKGLKQKKSLLLHSCCAPCSSAVLERVVPHFDVTVFYYNPNITESEEYYVRLNEQKKFLSSAYGEEVKLIEGRYFSREFFDSVKVMDVTVKESPSQRLESVCRLKKSAISACSDLLKTPVVAMIGV